MNSLELNLIKKYVDKKVSTNLQGKSAYQIAVDEGFFGTKNEWLQSLKGTDGTTPDVSNKENISNKVTSISAQSTDTQYPSAKLLYDQLALKQNASSAFSGNYNDLINKPTIPAAQVQSDWNASSGMGAILNKPTIPTVPTNISAFTNNVGYITSPFSETGTITSNNAGWYDAGTTITGTYALMGDMCILRAYAGTKSGWGEVHYTLPVAAAQGASAVAYEGGHQYIISTGEQSNISVCTIRKIGGGNQQENDTIHFTLIYRYQ